MPRRGWRSPRSRGQASAAGRTQLFSLLNLVHAPFLLQILAVPAATLTFLTTLATLVGSALAVPVAVLAWREKATSSWAGTPRMIATGLAAGLILAAAASATLYANRDSHRAQPGDLTINASHAR